MSRVETATVLDVLVRGVARIEENGYAGYDPADLLNTSYESVENLPPKILRILTLINFYSPINFRSLLKIRPAQNTTAMVLMVGVYLELFERTGNTVYRDALLSLTEWLLERKIEEDDCWGWDRTIQYCSRTGLHNKRQPLTFIGALAADTFFRCYEALGRSEFLEYAQKSCDGLMHFPSKIKTPKGTCLSYTAGGTDEIVNASALAGSVLQKLGAALNRSDYTSLASDALGFLLNSQLEDGSWWYSYKNGEPLKKQIDFHQTYNINALLMYQENSTDSAILSAVDSGVNYYIERQFTSRGYPFWRNRIPFPICVHNASHAVSFLSSKQVEHPRRNELLEKNLEILVGELYSGEGYFYYHKYAGHVVKHDFFRWNTIWSLHALCIFLSNRNG